MEMHLLLSHQTLTTYVDSTGAVTPKSFVRGSHYVDMLGAVNTPNRVSFARVIIPAQLDSLLVCPTESFSRDSSSIVI